MLWDFNAALQVSLIIFPIVALAMTLPYMIYQYLKHGSLIIWRTVVIYSFAYYLLLVYFVVILPLPSRSQAASMTTPYTQLQLFETFRTFVASTSFSWSMPSRWLSALSSINGQQILLNILLTIPLGVYLHYYFNRSLVTTLLMSFLVSLFLELTQLSALYGLYPRPYRLFDVDDLFLNTAGGGLGYFLGYSMKSILPSRDDMNLEAYTKRNTISYLRRITAAVVDGGCILFLSIITYKIFIGNLGRIKLLETPKDYFKDLLVNEKAYALVIGYLIVFFILVPWLTKGYTIGKRLVGLKLVATNKQPVRFHQLLARYIPLFTWLIFVYVSGLQLLYLNKVTPDTLDQSLLLILATGIVILCMVLDAIISWIKKTPLAYEVISTSINMNVVDE